MDSLKGFHSEALKTDNGGQNSSRSREKIHVRGQCRLESEDERAGQFQQPGSFHNNGQAGPTLSHRYTPQNNEQPLNNCTRLDGHYNNGYNNNIYNGLPSLLHLLTDWMQNQAPMVQNTLSVHKISIDNLTSDSLKGYQWFGFFKATIHNKNGLLFAQNMTYLQNSVTHKARDCISEYSDNGDNYHEAIVELTRKLGKTRHMVAEFLDHMKNLPKPRLEEPNTFVSFTLS